MGFELVAAGVLHQSRLDRNLRPAMAYPDRDSQAILIAYSMLCSCLNHHGKITKILPYMIALQHSLIPLFFL